MQQRSAIRPPSIVNQPEVPSAPPGNAASVADADLTGPDGYRLAGVARDGERAILYDAVRTSDNLRVLLKTPRSQRPTEREIAQLIHELAVLTHLSGTPVARAIGMVETGSRPWLVLEDCGGQALNRIAGRYRDPTRALALGARVAAALAEVHARGVIHLDLKPHLVIVLDDGSVRLTGFRSASLLRIDRSPSTMQGSPEYMAPEQTGRMNRSVDRRADLYALGVVLYELLTGRLPFQARDPLEWAHAHIAKVPRPPSHLDERIPSSVDAIVLKLLSKRAEDRYQSANGLQRDLECGAAAIARGDAAAFELASEDTPEEFRVASGLYGREAEVAQLLAGFERARSSGSCAVVSVGGASGVGKTSMVGGLYSAIVRERGRFIAGKFDQYKRDIPYATIVQAFRDLLRGLLAAGEVSLARWRSRIREALGINGRLIGDVIPELVLIVGPQLPVAELDPNEGRNRFELVFAAFIRVFAQPEHPLVVFLDDMQWADEATLGLLKALARPGQVPDLQLVLAFRSNETDAAHPFPLALDAMRAGGASVDSMTLLDLEPRHVLQLVADTVWRDPADVASLAALVGAKTGGNPFFIGELLQALHARGLLTFDVATRGWTWDDDAIRAVEVTDNVVDLLIGRIRLLSDATRRALTVASCFGSRFDVESLAGVLDQPLDVMQAALYQALADGFVVATDDAVGARRTLRFQHDRIQQAAYSFASGPERAATHLRIGRTLRSRFDAGEDTILFDAVKHLDHGISLILDEGERQWLVELNLLAGRRAKAAIAHEAARVYLKAAESLFGEDAWTAHHPTTFAVLGELAECEFLGGRFDEAEARFDELRQRAVSRAQRGNVATLQVKLYVVMGRYDEALRLGLAELTRLGDAMPEAVEAVADALVVERERLSVNLAGLGLGSIVDLPVIADAEARALISLLASLAPAVYSRRPPLFPVLAMRIVNLSLEHGNSEHSCFGYSLYAMVLAGTEGEAERAFTLSEASIALNERFGDPRLRGTVLHVHANHILFWRRPYSEAIALQEMAYAASMEVGDLTIAAYVSFMGGWQCLARGQPNGATDRTLARFEELAQASQHDAAQLTVQLQRQFVRALGGLTKGPLLLSDEHFDADQARSRIAATGFDTGLVMHDLLRVMLAWHHGQFAEAESWLVRGAKSLPAAFCLPLESAWALFDALTAAARWDAASAAARPALAARVNRAEERLRRWAASCPENFGAEHGIVVAEVARLQARTLDALRGYEQASNAARLAGRLPLEGIAAQLAARLAGSLELTRAARSWLGDQHAVLSQWGATALLSSLTASNPELRGAPACAESLFAHSEKLDALTAVKASQALSRETAVDGLTQALLQIALAHVGAQRAVVSMLDHGLLRPSGAASIDGGDSEEMPASVVNYVQRTCEPIVLADATADPTFADDDYVRRTRARSVLCFPILVHSQLVGLIYLENNLITGAFSSERLALLEVVSTQFAISLENAQLTGERQLRAEQAARQQASTAAAVLERRKLAELFAQAPAAIAVLEGAEHVFVLANSHYSRLSGDRPLLQLGIRQALPELEGQGYFELLDRVFETGETFEAREAPVRMSRAPAAAPTDSYFDFIYQPFRGVDETVNGIMVLAFDVTERVRARHQLRDNEQRLRLAIEASNMGDWEMDPQTGEIGRSVKFDEIFGYRASPTSWSFADLLEHVLPEGRAAVNRSFGADLGTAGTWQVECEIKRADDTIGWIELRGQLRQGGEDRPKRMFGTVVDITQRKTAEAERLSLTQGALEARREAEGANRSKDEFLAMLGHELRNPLAPIVTALHLLRLRDGDRNQRERSIIERQVTHLVTLVDDLLDVSRITSGKIVLRRECVEIADVVAKAIELASPLLEQRRHELLVSVPRPGLAVDGDVTRLAQVLSNLLANAAKYTEAGGRVTILAERVAESIELRVRDTGIGIAPEMLPKVFDLFAQEKQALSRSQGGLGLGLAIVHSLVRLHGGTVSAQSAGLGHGSEFTIRLPAATAARAEDLRSATASPEASALADHERGAALSILVVDDNNDAADLLALALGALGHTVRVAYDGPSALRALTDFAPEVAFLDIGLPIMDGYELAQLLQQNPKLRQTHLVAVTGYGQEADRQRSREAGFEVHLVKPIDMAALKTMVAEWARERLVAPTEERLPVA